MRYLLLLLFVFTLVSSVRSASPGETQKLLKGARHSWCPHALPAETSLDEIQKVIDLGFDVVGITFVGPYNGGKIDLSSLDQAVAAAGKAHQRVILHLTPRFSQDEGICDRLDNGRVITNTWNKSPNYAMIDVFDKAQRGKFCDWIRRVATHYGKDERVAGFVIGWGNLGETGFFHGDFWGHPEQTGSECAGYSENALSEFNRWRKKLGMSPVDKLPLPSTVRQSDDYILFHRFRTEFIRNVFHREMIATAKSETSKPVGTFGYISASIDSYARDWVDAPNADFYRSAGSASSFDMDRTLIDSGIGWEDSDLHNGRWNFSAACMERDEARQIARGGAFHAMYVRGQYDEPQWEKGVFEKVCSFLKTQNLAKRVRRSKPTVAFYKPTWGAAALPSRSETQKFLPKAGYSEYISKMTGMVESFGLPYRFVTESDLMDPARLEGFKHVIVPMWEMLPRILDRSRFEKLLNDPRVVKVPIKDGAMARSEFRSILQKAGVKLALDFDSERIVAGRTANLVYNWDDKPVRVRVPEGKREIELQPYEYLFVGGKEPLWDPKKATLPFSLEQGWDGLITADDQLAVSRIVKALEPLKDRYNVCLIVNPTIKEKEKLRHILDSLADRQMPFMLDVLSSDTFTLGTAPQNNPADRKHGVSITVDELRKFKDEYGKWLVGIRFHEMFAEDFTVRSEKVKRQGWLPKDLPLPDDDFFQPKTAEEFIEFARDNGMFVQWSDWHWFEFASWDNDQKAREADVSRMLKRYPGLVTVTYANNEPNAKAENRLVNWEKAVEKFKADGAAGIGVSDQTWYAADETACPAEDIIAWAESAVKKGAKIVQFEPVWWFFKLPRGSSGGSSYPSDPKWTDRGTPTENFNKLLGSLTDPGFGK